MNGIDTVVGESICMPMAIRMFEMTRSITRKGRKIRKPISKATDSSLTVKAGTTTRKSRSVSALDCSGLSDFCAVFRKKARSSGRLCLIRNSRSGSLAWSAARSMLWVLLPMSLMP